MLRRVFLLLCFDVALLAANACDNFSGSSQTAADGGTDAAAPSDAGMPADGATIVDSSDAGTTATGVCSDFDAAADTPATGNLAMYPCAGGPKDLRSDNANCGACGHVCTETACTDGLCPPYAFVDTSSQMQTVHAATVKNGHAYYVGPGLDGGFDEVYAIPTTALPDAGSFLTTIPFDGYNIIFDVTIDDRIYLRTHYQILTAPLDGGPVTLFADNTPEQPGHLAVDSTHLFATSNGAKFRVYDKSSGAPQPPDTNASGARDIAVTPNGKYVFYVALTAADGGMVDGSPVTRATVFRYTIASRALDPMFDFDPVPDPIDYRTPQMSVDNDFVYVASSVESGGNILRGDVEAPGSPPVTISKGMGRKIVGVVSDAKHVYFMSSTDTNFTFYDVTRVSRCGGPDTVLVSSAGAQNELPYGITLDDTYVYFGAPAPVVYRVPK
jgi:hypothetical protein